MTTAIGDREAKGWRTVHLIYALYALGFFTTGLATVAGVILAHMKAGRGVTYDINSHFKRQIDIFWTIIVVGILGIVLSFVGIGWLVLLGLTLWFVYATAKGWIAASGHEPV